MKLRNLLLCGVCALSTTFALAQNQTFPFTLTTADGLPEQTSAAASAFTQWVSPTYTFDEPVSSFRLTVTHTSWQDAFNTSANGGRGYVFFTMGEFYLYDAAGNPVELTPENFNANATEAVATGDGSIANLCDGDVSTHYHTCYSDNDGEKPIGAEHWLEITLPEPMTSFSFGWYKRSNNANIPCEVIVTKGGVDADPFADYDFKLGEQVENVEPGQIYVMCDNGNVSAYEGTYLYVAPNGIPGYYSTSGQNAYHVRRKANVDCIYQVIDAGDGTFYLKNYLNGSFVGGAAGFQEQATLESANKLTYDPETNYLEGVNGYHYSTNSQASFVGYESTSAPRSMYFYKATINSKYAYKEVEKAIAEAESALADYKEKFAESDNGETEALEAALATAKAVNSGSACDELFVAALELNNATSNFLKVALYIFIDEITENLETAEFGTEFGMYPVLQKNILEETLSKLMNDVDNRSFASLEDTKKYVDNIQAILDEFYASKITTFTELPIHLIGENGAVVFTKMEGLGNYIYTSPTICLPEPIEQIFITTVATNTGDHGGGWPCTNWAHFTLRDAEGEEVFLTADNISTNALETSEGSIEGLVDFKDDGTPDLTTYLHTLYSSSDPSTNEHYICITFPEPMSMFSFDLISRENGRLVPTEMVIDTIPYHYVADATVTLREQITKASELDPNKYYIFYGNINKVDKGAAGSGFYAGIGSAGETPQKEGVFRLVPTDKEDTYKVNFVVEGYYLERPTSWAGATSTINESEAGEFTFTESENLADAFKVWAGPTEADEMDRKYMLQDWSGSMGYFTIAGEGFESDDKDGESDWYVYEVDPVAYKVYLSQVKKLAQLNTDDKFAMYGNLGKVNPDAGSPGGYYRNIKAIGETANNFTLFNLEEGANGTYKIHFIDDDVYLKAPTGWASMEVTEKAEEAGEFVFAESSNLAGAFKIYVPGTFNKNDAQLEGFNMLQDWGESMGSYPIASFDEDDTDGESDWYLFTPGDPNEEELFREDYLGAYVWQWNNYWTPSEIKEFEFNLVADPDSEDGVIIDSFNVDDNKTEGPVKGTFDGKDHTISFPTGQVIWEGDERYWGTVMIVGDDSYEKNIVFHIDLLNEVITFSGQVGVQYVGRDGNDNGGWWMISSSWVKLIKQGGDHVDRAVAGDAEVVSTSFFTVNGQAIAAPVQGVNIIRTVLSDGTVKTAKVLIK
ncbi:MAG: hypothetical protein IKH59_00165 [Bacteroidaceae bacterium]|nr:hypothetical protein [Bacteroidaceae bacterium]